MWFWWPVLAPRMLSLPSLFSLASPTTYILVEVPGWDYATVTDWGEGDIVTERRIRAEVATPCHQLGIVNDALVAAIKALEKADALDALEPSEKAAIARFENMAGMITKIVEEERGKRPGGLRHIPSADDGADGSS